MEHSFDQGVGAEIKRLREEREWSMAKLAVEADMSVSGVSMIENGKRNLTTTTLAKLATALGVEIRDLFPLEQAPLPDFEVERRHATPPAGYEALAAWDDYLGLTLTRWEKLRRQFQDLANREPEEERDADDLLRALVDCHEFFRAVDRLHVAVGGFDVPRFGEGTDVESRELVWMVRERAERLGRIAKLFLEYSERLTKAMEDRQSEWAQREVEKFLESLREEEARTADVR